MKNPEQLFMLRFVFRFFSRSGLLALAVLCLVGARDLAAQGFDCQGPGCDFLSFNQSQMDELLFAAYFQHALGWNADMVETDAAAGMSMVPMGSVGLRRFTVGLVGAGAWVNEREDVVIVPDQAEIGKLRAGGGSLVSRGFVGFNLGGLFKSDSELEARGTPKSVLDRIDLYLAAGAGKIGDNPNDRTTGDLSVTTVSRGMELRYLVVPGFEIARRLDYRGLTLGAGAYSSSQHSLFHQRLTDAHLIPVQGTQFFWRGRTFMERESHVVSVPLEVNTAVKALGFLNLSVGGGVVYNQGEGSFRYFRYGQVFAAPDLDAVAGVDYTPHALLIMQAAGKSRAPSRLTYGRLGVEFDFRYVKIAVGGMLTRRTYGANISARVEY